MAKKRKWDEITSKLPKLQNPDPTYEERVEERKLELMVDKVTEEVIIHTPVQLAEMFASLRMSKAQKEAELSDIDLTLEAVRQMMVDTYEAEDLTSLSLAGIGTIRIDPEPHAVVKDKTAFREWCIGNGYADSLQLLWQTTNAICKERLEKGEDLPPGIEVFCKDKPVFTAEK